uniref:Uncharacterized protein n=1 Tax=Accipiter nisus TaxID=211598 RepID=A0A8B9NCY0_9AVES
MTERQQRARVQGGWASAPAGRPSAPKVAAASNLAPAAARPAWMRKDQPHTQKQFVFEKPSEVERKVPETGVIDKPGVYELSKVPSGIARIHLIPGFIDSEQADWMFEQLLQDIPWGQRTHVRQGKECVVQLFRSFQGHFHTKIRALFIIVFHFTYYHSFTFPSRFSMHS